MPDHLRVERCLPYYLKRHGLEGMQVIPITRGLATALQADARAESERLWAVVYHLHRGFGRKHQAEVTVSGFRHLTVVALQDPSGEQQEDATALLLGLLDLLRKPEAHFEVHLALVELYAGAGNQIEALNQLEQAGMVKPDRSSACLALADARRQHGRLEEAIPEYERAIALAPNQVRAYYGLATAYERLGLHQQAREVYEDLLAVKPASTRAQESLHELP
jgi:tetratricopeptide (TPR) repeat protein